MPLGTCSICTSATAKYKCPKCPVEYCSVVCYKSPDHVHGANTAKAQTAPENFAPPSVAPDTDRFLAIAADPVIQKLLGYRALQVHLAVLLRILSDSRVANEPLAENRRDIANMRLCELRMHGQHENELVEEFVQRVLQLVG